MNNRILTTILVFVTAMVIWVGCSKQIEEWGSPEQLENSQIAIGVEPVEDVVIRSGTKIFDTFDFYLVKSGKKNVELDIFKKFDFATNKIYIDGLSDGKYELYILATVGDCAADSAVINKVNSLDECWLEFQGRDLKALQTQYYRESIGLEVKHGSLMTPLPSIRLKHLSGQITFLTEYKSDFAQRTTTAIKVKTNKPIVASSFSLKGEGSKPKKVAEIDIAQLNGTILLPPTVNDEAAEWFITHDCAATFMDDMSSAQIVRSEITSSVSKSIKLNLNHKYDEYGLCYFEKEAAENYGQGDIKFTKIFTQDEGHDYYRWDGPNRRYVTLKSPNTITVESAKPALKRASFFNMQRVEDVVVYAKIDGSKDKYRIVQFEELPPFVELDNIELVAGANLFLTKDGRCHRIEVTENSVLSEIEVVYAGEDSFSKFLGEIAVPWVVQFNNNIYYATFSNGRYARECLCQMFNIAWIFSQDGWWEYLDTQLTRNKPESRPDVIWTDQGDGISFETYKNRMLTYNFFRIGRVPDGHGVAGYGQPNHFAVLQGMWVGAFSNPGYHFNTIIHEMGHGYGSTSLTRNHVSNLVTGNGSATSVCGICQRYFSSIMSKLPFPTAASINALQATHTKKN